MQDIQTIAFVLASSLTLCAAVALYTHLAGFSRRATLHTSETARQKMEDFLPNSTLIDFKMTTDKRTALGLFDNGNGCLLYAMGDNWLFQRLTDGNIRQTKMTRDGKLHLIFDDYTTPGIKISIENENERDIWRDALKPFFDPHVASAIPALTAK